MSAIRLQAILLSMVCGIMAYAQQVQPAAVPKIAAVPKTGAVPNVIRFSGTLQASGRQANSPASPSIESITLAVYRDQTGGSPLWQEIQNVEVDADGKYSLLMGSTLNDGMPMELFNSGEPRWLGVQVNRGGEAEQPRVLLASVPYALKSVDAETLGGRPASAYLLADAAASTTSLASTGAPAVIGVTAAATSKAAVKPRATNGTAGFIGVFTDATDIGNSVMQQSGGFIGVGTVPGAGAGTTPSLDLRTFPFSQIGMAQTTDYLTFFSSDTYGPAIYWNPGKDLRFGKGGTPLYNPFGFTEQMRIQSSSGNVGIGTQTPASKLDVAGDINFTGRVRYQGSPALQVNGNPSYNIAMGLGALSSNTSGLFNSAIGTSALASNTGGNQNTAIGYQALQFNTGGTANTATGNGALTSNTASFNTADGDHALYKNTTGVDNTATGQGALFLNTTGQDNTANGYLALENNTDSYNTAVGSYALQSNTTGNLNTAAGYQALQNNTGGLSNTSIGSYALAGNTLGDHNTAIGYSSLLSSTGGVYNIGIGSNAGSFVSGNNSYNIEIFSSGTSADNGIIRIGESGFQVAFFAAGVRNVTTNTNDAIPVLIDSAGQLGTMSSSRRFKEDIEDMGAASHDLMRLRPVTFRYKKPFADGSKPIQYGLIAEEVAEVYPDLVAHSADGQIETVKYQVLDSMLLNEVQRQQAEIGAQKEQLRRLERQNVSLQERLDKLEAAMTSTSRVSGVAAVR